MKTLKIITITFLIILILTKTISACDEIFTKGDDWISTGRSNLDMTMNTTQLKDSSNKMYNLLLIVGSGVAVIVGAVLGIKYMTAGIEEKVKVKESLVPYLISCAVLFGTFGIWKLAITIMKNFT